MYHLEIKQDLEHPARHGSLRPLKAAFPLMNGWK